MLEEDNFPIVPTGDSAKRQSDQDERGGGSAPPPELYGSVAHLRSFMDSLGLKIQCNGSIFDIKAPLSADGAQTLAAFLRRKQFDKRALIDEFMLAAKEVGLEISLSVAVRSLNYIIRTDRKARRIEIIDRVVRGALFEPGKASLEWRKLARIFLEPEDVVIAFWRHAIWQIKRKHAGHVPAYHLMLVIYSPGQSAGKTTLLRKMLGSVFHELAPPPALLSDFVDPRAGELFDFPVLLLDDIHKCSPKDVENLKQILTAPNLMRRRTHTNGVALYDQNVTVFATTNRPIEQIVPDPSGHRRFFTFTMRSGQEADDGDPEIWDIVNGLDFQLLFDSVDAWGACPIENYLHHLFRRDTASDPLREWLITLDLESHAFTAIETRYGARASGLCALFNDRNPKPKHRMTETDFGRRMNLLTLDPEVPFASKLKKSGLIFYPIKPGFRDQPAS